MTSTIDLKQYEVWFVTGSQHLYGPQVLEKVNEHSTEIAAALDRSPQIPVRVVCKPVLTGPDEISRRVCQDANAPQLRRPDHLDAHLFARQDVDCGPVALRSRWRICTRSTTAIFPGPTSTWTS